MIIISNYNKNQPKKMSGVEPLVPPRPLANVRPDLNPSQQNNGPIILNKQGFVETPIQQRPTTSTNNPTRPTRTARRIGRIAEVRQQRRDDLDLNTRSQEIELDLGRRSGNIDIEIPPDAPGYLDVSEDFFGPR